MNVNNFLQLSLNELNDPEVAQVSLGALNISDDELNQDDVAPMDIDYSRDEFQEQSSVNENEDTEMDLGSDFDVGEQRINGVQQRILNSQNPEQKQDQDADRIQADSSNIEGGNSAVDNIMHNISQTGKNVLSPTQLGAGIARRSLMSRLRRIEDAIGVSDGPGIGDISQDENFQDQSNDDIYSETPLKNKSLKSTSEDYTPNLTNINSSKRVELLRNLNKDSTEGFKFNQNNNSNDLIPKIQIYDDNKPTESTQVDSDDEEITENHISNEAVNTTPAKLDVFKTPKYNRFVETPWGKTPVQLQMHHHYHYHANSSNKPAYSTSTPFQMQTSTPLITDYPTDYALGADAYPEPEEELPSPWSRTKNAKSPLPYIISSYLQMIFNFVTVAGVFYVLYSVFKGIRSDISTKLHEKSAEMMIEASICAKKYKLNKCDPEHIAPALEKQCFEWEKCMNKKPSLNLYHASVSAEILGVIVNSLIEPIGVKAFTVFIILLALWLFASNFFFGLIRGKSYYTDTEAEKAKKEI